MWVKVDWKAGLFEAAIDAKTLWILAQILMLAGVISASNSIMMF